jgi:Rha family phage regulatory protein
MIKLFEGGDQTQQTMSSLLIAEITGKRHDHVMRDCKKLSETLEKEGEPKFGLSYYRSEQNKELPMYVLTKEQTYLLVTGYSAPLRLKVIRRLEELENKQPKPLSQIELIIQSAQQLLMIQQVQEKQAERIAILEAKQISETSEFYTIAGYCALRGLKKTTQECNILGRKATKMSKELDYTIGSQYSAAYGRVNTYHLDILTQIVK